MVIKAFALVPVLVLLSIGVAAWAVMAAYVSLIPSLMSNGEYRPFGRLQHLLADFAEQI